MAKIEGTRKPGQGYLITGTAEIVTAGAHADAVKGRFPWARGALVIRVEQVKARL